MRRTSKRIIALTLALGSPSFCVVGLDPLVAHVSATSATVCSNEQYEWRGNANVAAGQSFATGIVIPAQSGTQVILVGSSSSADPFATSFVNVTVAGVVAVEQAVVAGGEIAAVNIGTDGFVLTTVGVAISRCHQVAQAAVAIVAPGPNLSQPLPATGRSSTPLIVAAGLLVIGMSLMAGARRRYSGSSAGR